MMNVARLKEKARALELKEQWREALELYTRLVEESPPEVLDISLWNRIGDLHLRLGQAEAAVAAYERAVEAYVEAGLANNAIALCNKILRTDPGCTSAYLRLGQISAAQGFLTDARASFLLYAERLNRAGRVEEALDALKEFAALAPEDVEVRLRLADQLHTHGRDVEAMEQLQLARSALRGSDRSELAAEVRERILALDPDAAIIEFETALPSTSADDEDVEEPGGEEVALLPTFELGVGAPEGTRDRAGEELPPIELVPTAHVDEPIVAELALQEISHLEGLEPTQADDATAEGELERLVEEPDAEADLASIEALPLLEDGLEMLDPASVELPEPREEPGADVESGSGEEGDEEVEPLPLIPSWGEVDLTIEPTDPVDEAPPSEPSATMPETSVELPVLSDEPLPPPPPAPPAAPVAARDDYVDLAALIFDAEELEPSTRFVVAEEEPSGDEDRDFAEMLARFRQKVDENIASDDSASHYDLGLAFKDMGLLDEAIAQFQVALRGGANPLATLEVLGECFIEKSQYTLASRVLERALELPGASDAALIGVFYLYARAEEALGSRERAIEFYERVLAIDIRFRDARTRLAELQRSAPPAAF